MKNPLIDFFRDFLKMVESRDYNPDENKMYRVPMTPTQIARVAETLEDGEYFRDTTEMFCDQVDEVHKHLDDIESRTMNLTELCETQAQLREVREIMSQVNAIREFYGRIDDDE